MLRKTLKSSSFSYIIHDGLCLLVFALIKQHTKTTHTSFVSLFFFVCFSIIISQWLQFSENYNANQNQMQSDLWTFKHFMGIIRNLMEPFMGMVVTMFKDVIWIGKLKLVVCFALWWWLIWNSVCDDTEDDNDSVFFSLDAFILVFYMGKFILIMALWITE